MAAPSGQYSVIVSSHRIIIKNASRRELQERKFNHRTRRASGFINVAVCLRELTASLVEMLGLREGTRLELVPPAPLVEHLSLKDAADKAAADNVDVIEAEQTAIKANAGAKLSQMAYFPSVAIIGGYTDQSVINGAIFPHDASYIGLMGSWTLFGGFKREHRVKEASAQAQAADLGVSSARAKVAAKVKDSYFELDRSRKLSQLARRMVSATQVLEASYKSDAPDIESARAKMQADMFRTELEYRQAVARLETLMGRQMNENKSGLQPIEKNKRDATMKGRVNPFMLIGEFISLASNGDSLSKYPLSPARIREPHLPPLTKEGPKPWLQNNLIS
jgi:hypothetical protein